MATLTSTLKDGKAGFFALLHKRMEEKGDFPALSKSVRDFSETVQKENVDIADITGTILSDFALTQKVIRLANSAMYSAIGGEITTISKAAMVIGLDALSYLVISIRLVDTFSISAPDSEAARLEMVKALLAGHIAREIATKSRVANAEEAVVCALMRHLSRLLLAFYFPEEWSKIKEKSADKLLSENGATQEVIGVTLDEISQEVAGSWRLPKKIVNSMLKPISFVEVSIPGSPVWLKMTANFSKDAAESMIADVGKGLAELAAHYSDTLLLPVETILESVNLAANDARESSIPEAVVKEHGKPADSIKQLAAGVREITNALARGENFGNALNLVLETMYGSMGFNRVAALLRDGNVFRGRVGFGDAMPEVLPNFSFPGTYAADVFHLALANNADVFIGDVTGSKSAASIPSWLTETLPDVRAFILLPMSLNGRHIGVLYGDFRKGTKAMVEQEEMVLMRALRDNLMKSLSSK